MHLHWLLPHPLRGVFQQTPDGKHDFPAAPNWWVVKRETWDQNHWTSPKYWRVLGNAVTLLEYTGDHSYTPAFSTDEGCGISNSSSADVPPVVPMAGLTDSTISTVDPYFYLGAVDRVATVAPGASGDQSDQNAAITALFSNVPQKFYYQCCKRPFNASGWGDPSWRSFYPNCRPVFGMADNDTLVAPGTKFRYTIVGWYHSYADKENKDSKGSLTQTDPHRPRAFGGKNRSETEVACRMAGAKLQSRGDEPERSRGRLPKAARRVEPSDIKKEIPALEGGRSRSSFSPRALSAVPGRGTGSSCSKSPRPERTRKPLPVRLTSRGPWEPVHSRHGVAAPSRVCGPLSRPEPWRRWRRGQACGVVFSDSEPDRDPADERVLHHLVLEQRDIRGE